MRNSLITQRSVLFNYISVLLGTVFEWAEFILFMYLSPILGKVFFPESGALSQQLKALMLFAASYFVRPLGTIIFGHIGDRLGRKKAIIISMALMSFATFCMGMLPTYADWGVYSTLLLVLFRFLQVIAVSSELNGATVYLLESSQANKRVFIASLVPFAASLGMFVGSAASAWVDGSSNPSLYWRIPFIAAGILGGVAILMRAFAVETPVFERLKSSNNLVKLPFKEVVTKYFKEFITVFIAGTFISVFVYTAGGYSKMVLLKNEAIKSQAGTIVSFGQFLASGCILLFGMIITIKRCYNIFRYTALALVFAGPAIFLLVSGSLYQAYLAQVIYAVINGLASVTLFSLVSLYYPAKVRYSGFSFAWAVAAAIFGGSSLVVSDLLVNTYGITLGPGYYMSFMALLSFVVMSLQKERNLLETDKDT